MGFVKLSSECGIRNLLTSGPGPEPQVPSFATFAQYLAFRPKFASLGKIMSYVSLQKVQNDRIFASNTPLKGIHFVHASNVFNNIPASVLEN